MAEIYSHSRLSSFKDCPRRFQYRYVHKIPAETESIEAFLGKRVHDVLERLYQATGRGHVPSLPQVIKRYLQLFDEAYDGERIAIVRSEHSLDHYRELGAHCLANYYRRHYPFDADDTLGLEERVSFELGRAGGARVRFQGFVDRIAEARDGAIEIHDYKTSARVPDQSALDADRQLALYQLGLTERFGPERPMRLVWHYLRRNRVCTSARTGEQLAALRDETLALVERIRSETRFEARPSALCRWCEYRARCPDSPERDERLPPYGAADARDTGAALERAPRSASDQLALPLAAAAGRSEA